MKSHAEQMAELRERTLAAEIEGARAQVALEVATAQLRATRAETHARYLARRLDELEHRLGRRQAMSHEAALGIARFGDVDGAIEATLATPGALHELHLERFEQRQAAHEAALEEAGRGAA
jgi:hypothetical protein